MLELIRFEILLRDLRETTLGALVQYGWFIEIQ